MITTVIKVTDAAGTGDSLFLRGSLFPLFGLSGIVMTKKSGNGGGVTTSVTSSF